MDPNTFDFGFSLVDEDELEAVQAASTVVQATTQELGTVQDRFDIDLVEFIAKENNDKSIVIVGPVWNNEIVDKLSKYSNIYFPNLYICLIR